MEVHYRATVGVLRCEAQALSCLGVVGVSEERDTLIRVQGRVNQGKENNLFRDKFNLCCESGSFAVIGNQRKYLRGLKP